MKEETRGRMTTSAKTTGFDPAQYRDAMGRFVTGVAIVTCPGDGKGPVGVTVNSFTSLSVEPPLLLWCLDNRSYRGEAFGTSGVFAVNVLARAQQALSVRFSESGQHDFSGVRYETGENGAPVLPGALAVFECALDARYDGGDHTIMVGRVTHLISRDGEPLLYYRGRYRGIGPHH